MSPFPLHSWLEGARKHSFCDVMIAITVSYLTGNISKLLFWILAPYVLSNPFYVKEEPPLLS